MVSIKNDKIMTIVTLNNFRDKLSVWPGRHGRPIVGCVYRRQFYRSLILIIFKPKKLHPYSYSILGIINFKPGIHQQERSEDGPSRLFGPYVDWVTVQESLIQLQSE